MGRIEREVAGFQLVDRETVIRAAVPLAVATLLEIGGLVVAGGWGDQHGPLPHAQGGLDRVGKAGRVGVRDDLAGLGVDGASVLRPLGTFRRLRVADHVAVHDDFDRMALVLVQLGRRIRDLVLLAIDTDADEALPPGAVDDPVALRLAVLDERCEHEQARALR